MKPSALTAINVLASLAALSGSLEMTTPALAAYNKVCGVNKGGYVAEYKLLVGNNIVGKDSGWSNGVKNGDEKCYKASDFSADPSATFTFYVRGVGGSGSPTTCHPTNQTFSSGSNSTAKYLSKGNLFDISCQMKN